MKRRYIDFRKDRNKYFDPLRYEPMALKDAVAGVCKICKKPFWQDKDGNPTICNICYDTYLKRKESRERIENYGTECRD